MKKGKVAVIGLTGQTAFFKTDHFPAPGESVSCDTLFFEPGGKGHNQAIACAKMGAATLFIGAVGKDANGQECRTALEQEEISVCLIQKEVPTAYAVVTLDRSGENVVEVYGGAAKAMTWADLKKVNIESKLKDCDYILIQNELSLECLTKIVELAYEMEIPVIFNPAPAADFSTELLRKCKVLTPNYGEAKKIVGFFEEDEPDERELWNAFKKKGISNVVVTLGGKGILLLKETDYQIIPAYSCGEVVDTTGAGDTFNGTLAAFLAEGKEIDEAVKFAVTAAGISVTRLGAAGGVPEKCEVMQHMVKACEKLV